MKKLVKRNDSGVCSMFSDFSHVGSFPSARYQMNHSIYTFGTSPWQHKSKGIIMLFFS